MAVTALPVKTTTPHHHLYTTLPLVTEHQAPPSNKNSACHCEIKMPFFSPSWDHSHSHKRCICLYQSA